MAGEDLESWAYTSEDGVRADDALLCKPRHPVVDAARQLRQDLTPVADFAAANRTIGILARATHEMDR